jgi:hypothetical protein
MRKRKEEENRFLRTLSLWVSVFWVEILKKKIEYEEISRVKFLNLD